MSSHNLTAKIKDDVDFRSRLNGSRELNYKAGYIWSSSNGQVGGTGPISFRWNIAGRVGVRLIPDHRVEK